MKKVLVILSLLLILSLTLTAVACNGATVTVDSDGVVTLTPADDNTSTDTDAATPDNDSADGGAQGEQGGEGQGENAQGSEGSSTGSSEGATVATFEELLRTYPAQCKALGDKLARAILRQYNLTDPSFCGYSFTLSDDNKQVSGMTVKLMIKLSDSECKYSTYRVTFTPLAFSDIAGGNATLSKTVSGFVGAESYNPEEKKGDAAFLSSLYEGFDFVYIAYVPETGGQTGGDGEGTAGEGGNGGAIDTPQTIAQLIAEHGAEIDANLATQYENVLKESYGRNYSTNREYVTEYQWDLGETNKNNEIQNAKLTFTWSNGTRSSLHVYNVTFKAPISMETLLDADAMSEIKANISSEYSFPIDIAAQGKYSELRDAILEEVYSFAGGQYIGRRDRYVEGEVHYYEYTLDIDDVDYQNAELFFITNGASVSAIWGRLLRYNVAVKNSQGIRQIEIGIQPPTSSYLTNEQFIELMIEQIKAGHYTLGDYKTTVTYSENKLPVVDLTENA